MSINVLFVLFSTNLQFKKKNLEIKIKKSKKSFHQIQNQIIHFYQ